MRFSLVLLLFVASVLASKDYYDLLHVSRDASRADIKRAYRKLSLTAHPDKGGDPKVFAEITNAYEVLSDDEKRRKYDMFGEEGLKNEGMNMRGNPFPFPFHFGGEQEGKKHLPHQVFILDVSLEDLYKGKVFKAAHRKHVICPRCRGSGARKPSDIKKCPGCNGTGVKIKRMEFGGFGFTQVQQTCDECGGKGTTIARKCPRCHGSKIDIQEEPITIEIEKGMDNGDEIVFPEEGDQRPDTTAGDLKFVIKTMKHSHFTRNKNDLKTFMHISLLEALTGFNKQLTHLDGHLVDIKRTEVTPPGFVLTVAGEGMPIKDNTSEFGKLKIEFIVDFPSKLTADQITAIKKIF